VEAVALDLAVLVFEQTEGAERAYSRAPAADSAWSSEVAFVEHHRHDRIVMRGTFAGHYVDADDDQDFIGAKTAEGAVGGAAVGALFGPPGLAAGFVAGGIAGSVAEEHRGPHLRGALFDEVRREVPEGSSALILLATGDDVDAMVGALEGQGGRLVRHHLTAEMTSALQAAVAESPSAAPRPSA
jgi:uncharacterized membrane protein